jgi:hypothetical protein
MLMHKKKKKIHTLHRRGRTFGISWWAPKLQIITVTYSISVLVGRGSNKG